MGLPDDLASWDAWLAGHGRRGGFGQTALWARILEATDGAAHRLVRSGDDGALMTLRPPPSGGVRARWRRRGLFAECMGGPVLRDVSALGDVLRTILEAASAANAGMLCITPPPAAGWGDMPDAQSAFAAAGFKRHDWLTLLVDLTVDETTLNERLHRSAPKAIRRAKREGLAVERLTDRAELAERFFRVYARFSGIDAETLTARGLATVDADDRCAYTWFVAVDTAGDVAATLGTCRHGGVAMEVMSSRTPDSTAPAQDLLHWEALCHHRAAGDEVFDLAGVSPSPHTAAEAGIRRFKEKWGGSAVAMPRYDIAL